MTLQASAPGKLVLLGEYAVLDGAPALVAAVSRRAHVCIEETPGKICRIESTEAHPQGAEFILSPRGRVNWRSRQSECRRRFALFAYVLERFARQHPDLSGFRVRLCTRELFMAEHKLGLGSSAALVVALDAALMHHADAVADPPGNRLARLLDLHANFQNGGSGLDVAASLFGGLICFARSSGLPRIEPMPWPGALHMLCLWSGRPASTRHFLRAVDEARVRDPQGHADQVECLSSVARRGEGALRSGDVARLLDAVDAYADALDAFGRACGILIMSPAHTQLRRLAAEAGAVYKPSGAGAGDVGVAFASAPGCLAKLRASASHAGFTAIDLELDRRGLTLE